MKNLPVNRKFKISGTADNVSKEEVRALLHAVDVLLCYHNVDNQNDQIHVKFVNDLYLGKTKCDGTCTGRYIDLEKKLSYDDMITAIIHEMVHVYFDIATGFEKITSTLTARIKKDVSRIANILVENTYKRAGYIAHTKISYAPKGRRKDYYDQDQNHSDYEGSAGKKYRAKKKGSEIDLFQDLFKKGDHNVDS